MMVMKASEEGAAAVKVPVRVPVRPMVSMRPVMMVVGQ